MKKYNKLKVRILDNEGVDVVIENVNSIVVVGNTLFIYAITTFSYELDKVKYYEIWSDNNE